jgi:2-oxoglutarate ferredoxin oxidoreductase subunit gamma
MKKKTERSFFAGLGGQGIVSLGQLWVSCAMNEGKNVTFFPFYGAEKRGGVARASVIVSEGEIASPLVNHADSALVMNDESLPLCEEVLRDGGVLVVNETLVTREVKRSGIRVIKVAIQEIAERVGSVRFANMVAFGALAKITGVISLKKIEATLKKFFPRDKHRFIPQNMAAIQAGFEAI